MLNNFKGYLRSRQMHFSFGKSLETGTRRDDDALGVFNYSLITRNTIINVLTTSSASWTLHSPFFPVRSLVTTSFPCYNPVPLLQPLSRCSKTIVLNVHYNQSLLFFFLFSVLLRHFNFVSIKFYQTNGNVEKRWFSNFLRSICLWFAITDTEL